MPNTDPAYLDIFRHNGQQISQIRDHLIDMAHNFATPEAIDQEAERLIKKAGGEPAFKKVHGYHWSTCICRNDGFVHCIPKGELHDGDLVTLDTGMYYRDTTTDTARTFVVGTSTPIKDQFITVGAKAVRKAVKQAIVGNRIKDISRALQRVLEGSGYSVTRNLCGHGLGKTMHEPPQIPCYIGDDPDQNVKIIPGMVLAIESMYMMGNWPLVQDKDGWTLKTADGSLSAMFEDDVIITESGPEVITASSSSIFNN